MNNFKINGTDPDNIMSKGQQVDRIYSKGTLVWEKSFPEVTIGTQTWKVKNLDIDDGGDGIYAYNDDESNVATYGRLYTWDAAMRIANSVDGWHLPTDAEWTTLTDYLGGESVAGGKLKEAGTTHWNSPNIGATNEVGFTALPGGRRPSNGTFDNIGYHGRWWSATEYNATTVRDRSMFNNASNVSRGWSSNEAGYSVRLIKDYSHTPTITLLGDSSVTISVGDTYTDAGATAYDTRYGDITSGIVVVNNVNTSVAGTYTVTYNINTEDGYNAEEVVRTVVVNAVLTEIWGTEIVEVTNPVTGRIWMDRNIGATRAATSPTDSEAYGHLFQWGRNPDGHELKTSGTTTTLSSTDIPGHDDFILSTTTPYDWRSPQNDNLWQGIIADGWRLPTEAEWEEEILSWATNNADGAYGSVLKLPVAGLRIYSNGSLYDVGSRGNYWSSSVDGIFSRYLYFYSSNANVGSNRRANGYSVRLIKD